MPDLGRVWRDALAPRGWRVDLPVFVLTLALGLGVAVSVKAQRGTAGLAADRQDELVSILASLGTRDDQLQQSIAQLQAESRELQTGGSAAALQEARTRTAELGILAGTIAAHGPGIVLTVIDPGRAVSPDVLVDAIEELRDAGAEAIDLSGVRVVAQTYVVAAPGGRDGRRRHDVAGAVSPVGDRRSGNSRRGARHPGWGGGRGHRGRQWGAGGRDAGS